MQLEILKIDNFRNIQSASLNFSPGLNFIFGQNGSGKTSILEALACLSTGRSFRTRKHASVINFEAPSYSLFAKGGNYSGLDDVVIGLQRFKNGRCDIKANGESIRSAAQLAKLYPLLVINSSSFELLEGSAKDRRQFFDWLVFHVKHEFRDAWLEYARAVKQRNSLLRRDKINQTELAFWNEILCRQSTVIAECRRQTIEPFLSVLQDYIKLLDLSDIAKVNIEFYQGWKEDQAFSVALKESLSRDIKYGYTTVGPHKSDLKFLVNNKDAVDILSRGQQKTFISAMYMAAMTCYIKNNKQQCMLLIDDLPSELDMEKRKLISEWVCELQLQSFITGIELPSLLESWPTNNKYPPKVFHVKHGVIKELEREWSELKND